MRDASHLIALQESLSRRKAYLASCLAKDVPFRQSQVEQMEREIESEMRFLGITPNTQNELASSADDLFTELMA